MEVEDKREEGELSDEDDVIITQVTRGRQHSGLHMTPLHWNIKSVENRTNKSQNDPSPRNLRLRNGASDSFVLDSSAMIEISKVTVKEGSDALVPTVQTESLNVSTSITSSSTQNANIYTTEILSPIRISTSESSNGSSGFIDKMRARGTSLLSPSYISHTSVQGDSSTSNITTFAYDIDLASIPAPPSPKPLINGDTLTEAAVVDLASIPTPPPPPLPNTPPPSVPLPPPEDPEQENSSPAMKASTDDIDDDFVDSLLEEATKQMQKDLDDMQDKTEVVDMELESSDDGEILDDTDTHILITNPPGMEDEDEDLDVLELRLAALASYAKSTRRSLEEKDDSRYDPERPLISQYKHVASPHSSSYGRDFGVRKRKRSGNYDDSPFTRKRYQDDRREREKRLRAEERLRREEERRFRVEDAYRRERVLREEEKRERKRLQEVEQKLNDLQHSMNPENMLQKMLQMVGVKSQDKKPNELLSLFAKLVDTSPSEDSKSSVVSRRERDAQIEAVSKSEHMKRGAAPREVIVDDSDIYSHDIPAATHPKDIASATAYPEEDNVDCLSMDMDSDSNGPVEYHEDHSDFANFEGDIFTKVDKNLPAIATKDQEEKATRIFPKQQHATNTNMPDADDSLDAIDVPPLQEQHQLDSAPVMSDVMLGCPEENGSQEGDNKIDDWLYGAETQDGSAVCTGDVVSNVDSDVAVSRSEYVEQSNHEVPNDKSSSIEIDSLNVGELCANPSEEDDQSKAASEACPIEIKPLHGLHLTGCDGPTVHTAEHIEKTMETGTEIDNSINQIAIDTQNSKSANDHETAQSNIANVIHVENLNLIPDLNEEYGEKQSDNFRDSQAQMEKFESDETKSQDDNEKPSQEKVHDKSETVLPEVPAKETVIEEIPEPDNDEIDAAILRAQLLASLKPRSPRTDASSQDSRSGPSSTVGAEEAWNSPRAAVKGSLEEATNSPSAAVRDSPRESPSALAGSSSPKAVVTGSGDGPKQMEKKRPPDSESHTSPRAKSKKRSEDDRGLEDEDEALMRAQLLASVARIRREKLEAEIEQNDAKIQAKTKLVKSSNLRRSPRRHTGNRHKSPPRKNGAKLENGKSKSNVDKSNSKMKTKASESKSKDSARSRGIEPRSKVGLSTKKNGDQSDSKQPEKKGKENRAKETVRKREDAPVADTKSSSRKVPSSLSDTSTNTKSKSSVTSKQTVFSNEISTTDSISTSFHSPSSYSSQLHDKNIVLTPEIPPPVYQGSPTRNEALDISFELPISDALRCRLGGITTNVGPVPTLDLNLVVPFHGPPDICFNPLVAPPPVGGFMPGITTPGIPTPVMTPHITTGVFPTVGVHPPYHIMDIHNPAVLPQTVMSLPASYPSTSMPQPPLDEGVIGVSSLQRAPTITLSKEMSKSISDISNIGKGIGSQESTNNTERKVEIIKKPKAAPPDIDRKVEIVQSIGTLSHGKTAKKKLAMDSIRIEKKVGSLETGVKFEDVLLEEKTQGSKQAVKVKFVPRNTKTKKVVSIPIVKPVVINLEEDTSDDDDYDTPMTSQTSAVSSGGGLLGSLDSFLKEARASVEQQQKQQPTTPEALKNLGPHGIAEYKKLREEIRRREEKLKASQAAKKAAMTTAVTSVREKNEVGGEAAKAEDAKKVHQLELRVQLQKKMLDQDEQNLNTLTSLVDKKKNVLSLAEKKMKQLEKQLEATRRIHQTNVEQISSLDEKCKSCNKQIGDRHRKIKHLQKEMLEKGRQTFGGNYIPFQSSNPKLFEQASSPDGKSKSGREPVVNEKGDNNTHSLDKDQQRTMAKSQTNSAVNQNDEGREREELESLHQQYADMIRRHKEDLKLQAESAEQAAKERIARKPEHIQTEENIKVTSDADSDINTFQNIHPKKRRRSIMGSTKGETTRPHLSPVKEPLKKRVKDVSVWGASSRESSPNSVSALPPGGFKMPSGQHMSRLCKLHKENLEKEVWFSKQTVLPLSHSQQAFRSAAVSVIPGAKYKPQTLPNRHPGVESKERPLRAYVSPLLRFKSYRLNPYFRTRAGIHPLSLTFSNKIDPKRMFCHFDLTGKCNDDKCPWQHTQVVQMSADEVLEDLAAYAPRLAGLSQTASPETYPKEIKNYVSTFRAKNALPAEQQVTLMTMLVNNAAKHAVPHTTFTEPRTWKPHIPCPAEEVDKESVHSFIFDKDSEPVPENTKVFEDDILCEGDMRYYLLGSEDIQDMEAGVLDDPHNITLWLKLAYKKLHEHKGKKDENVDQALNVLSRALESDRASSELWLHYLSVYAKRKDKADLLMLSQQALKYAPSYELHWKHLNALPLISQKRFHSNKIEEFLASAKCPESAEVKSHYLLEIILYRVQLYIISGRTNSALKTMREKCSSSLNLLTLADAVLFCMCYIHMLEFRSLPASMFEAGNTAPGRIVNKEPFVIDWKSKGATYMSTIRDFIMNCRVHRQFSEEHGYDVLLPLFKTLLQYRHVNGYVRGLEAMCNQLEIEAVPLCLCKLELHIDSSAGENLLQLYSNTLKRTPSTDVRIVHDAALVMISRQKTDEALELLEQVPFRFFDIPDEPGRDFDPNQLYCKLLKQELPMNASLPAMKDDVVKQLNLAHVWACYCLLQELQGFEAEVEQCYESAVASPLDVHDLRFIWKCYLHYSYKQLSDFASTKRTPVTATAAEAQPRKPSHPVLIQRQFQSFTNLVKRCLVAMPTKFPLPYQPDSHWLDYSFHNVEVVDMYVGIVDKDEKLHVYEDFVKLMPHNVELIIRACEYFYAYGAKTLALGTSRVALEDFKTCLPLWKLHLKIASEVNTPKEVLRLYRRAAHALPHALWLWTNYLLLASTCGKEENVKQILQKCKDLEINLVDFATTVLK